MTLTSSNFYNNYGYEGGVIMFDNKVSMTAKSVGFTENICKTKGGVFYAEKTSSATLSSSWIKFDSCLYVQDNEADYGGFGYVDNKYLNVKITSSKIQNHTAYTRSGFMEVINVDEVDIEYS